MQKVELSKHFCSYHYHKSKGISLIHNKKANFFSRSGVNTFVFYKFQENALKFSRSLKQFFLTVGQNNFGNKIQCLIFTTQKSRFKATFFFWEVTCCSFVIYNNSLGLLDYWTVLETRVVGCSQGKIKKSRYFIFLISCTANISVVKITLFNCVRVSTVIPL